MQSFLQQTMKTDHIVRMHRIIWIFFECSHQVISHTAAHLSINGKCPKISNTKVSDKSAYATSADLDQTAPEGAV